ncbi:hypothetical protein [Commensalibacter communis]|uniref:hypothetical protein n=1 Tax=Commensalibacter communis TaxID=2972786 RepID=UPI0022FF9176|nr:hypothetical protein [Commensalibacter communis]CAI3937039.1 unnamed protein product [Commensalibacter communis]CAI3941204.1 unnamed protein product [Commensalibacter communis]
MQTTLQYPLKSDDLIITKIFFINCLPDEDVGVFNRCYEDINAIILNKKIYKDRYERIDCDSAAKFLNALDKIFEEVNLYRLHQAIRANNIMQTVLPFIRIEAHGSKEAIQMANGEIVAAEIFYEKILKINIASENNTVLLSNTCYATSHISNLKEIIKTEEKGLPIACSVYAAFGPEEKINNQDIENNLVKLYENIFLRNILENINQRCNK